MEARCVIRSKLVPKKNRLVIRKSRLREWVAPDSRTQARQESLAWELKGKLPRFAGDVELSLALSKSCRMDLDNALGGVMDALQSAGVISNDRLAKRIEAWVNPDSEETVLTVREAMRDRG